jgi:hypothetical protein
VILPEEFPNDNPLLWVIADAPELPGQGVAESAKDDDPVVEVIAVLEMLESEDASEEPIEIVESFDDAHFAPGRPDPFDVFVTTLVEVARAAGGDRPAELVSQFLLAADEALDETARAWRSVLRGETEDLSLCGNATLDEWAAGIVARSMGEPAKTERVRQDLRRRGVAAFGLLDAA